MRSILIRDTTREEREQIVRQGLAACGSSCEGCNGCDNLGGGRVDAIVVRKQAKAHGMQRRIEGAAVDGRRVLVEPTDDAHTIFAQSMDRTGFARGTLAEEERYKINEHIVQTLIMLSQLPFPKHLRQVPEIAAGHHEKMDGTGYPKRLRGEDMSQLARMMAVADIFEALTAVDRPYKKGKTLSEAIKIMAKMRDDVLAAVLVQ